MNFIYLSLLLLWYLSFIDKQTIQRLTYKMNIEIIIHDKELLILLFVDFIFFSQFSSSDHNQGKFTFIHCRFSIIIFRSLSFNLFDCNREISVQVLNFLQLIMKCVSVQGVESNSLHFRIYSSRKHISRTKTFSFSVLFFYFR